MKNLKARVLIALVAIFMSSALMAQPQGRGQQGPPSLPTEKQVSKMVDEMGEELSLNVEQNEAINRIYNEHFKLVEEKQKAGRPERSEMEALKTSLNTEVKVLLTDEQKVAYDTYVKKQEEQQRSNRPQRR